MSISHIGEVDLQSVLNVRRRTLASIGESVFAPQKPNYTDTIYLKRIDDSSSILVISSKIYIFGELQLLLSIFERYASNIIVHEDLTESNSGSPLSSKKCSFSEALKEDESQDTDALPIVSTLHRTSISSSKDSSSPPQAPDSPSRKSKLASVGRSQTVISTASEYSVPSLEGKCYGSIEIPQMTMIEILELLLRVGLELVDVSSAYDKENVLHQNFVFSKTRTASQKYGQVYSRSPSIIGT